MASRATLLPSEFPERARSLDRQAHPQIDRSANEIGSLLDLPQVLSMKHAPAAGSAFKQEIAAPKREVEHHGKLHREN